MNKTILLVDDSRISRMTIKTIVLQLNSGWHVIEAENSEAALKLTQNQSFDIAAVHLNDSRLSGFKLAEKLIMKHPQSDYAWVTDNLQNGVRKKAKLLGLRLIDKPVNEEKIGAFLASC